MVQCKTKQNKKHLSDYDYSQIELVYSQTLVHCLQYKRNLIDVQVIVE